MSSFCKGSKVARPTQVRARLSSVSKEPGSVPSITSSTLVSNPLHPASERNIPNGIIVILTSAWSAGNSFLFAGSRSLYSLALTGQAPKIFRTCNKHGVPYYCVAVTSLMACLVYLSVSSGSATVFQWFVNLTTISGYIAWIILLITYLRFRRALEFNGLLDQRPYKTWGQPYVTYVALSLLILLTLTNGFQVFFPGKFTVSSFLAAYITLPIVIVLYLGHKIWFRTPLFLRVQKIDVYSGKEEADALEEMDVPPVAKNILQKIWFWIA